MLKVVCVSHSPLMDFNHPEAETEADVRGKFAELAGEVTAFDPELIILLAPDHYNGMFYDMMPSFCIGTRATAVGDWNSGSGDLTVPEDTALSLLSAVREAGIDAAVSYRLMADHGFTQPLMLLTGSLTRYPVVPVFINAAAPPLPACDRVKLLGETIGAFASRTQSRILIVASGGLSHDPPFPKMETAPPEIQTRLIDGRNPSEEAWRQRIERVILTSNQLKEGKGPCRPLNEEWDRALLKSFADGELDHVATLGEKEINEQAGVGGQEIRTWLAAFSALSVAGSYSALVRYYRAIPEWNAGMAMMTAEPTSNHVAIPA